MSGFGEQVLNFQVVEELLAFLHECIFVLALLVMLSKEVFQPQNRGRFRHLCVPMLHTGEGIGDEDPCCLPIQSFTAFAATTVLQIHSCKGEVDGQSLAQMTCTLCCVGVLLQ